MGKGSNAATAKSDNRTMTRNPAFDLLRVVSLLGVIVMHVTSGVTQGQFTGEFEYLLKLVYNAPFHYGVPIFVMISGALFLAPGKTISIKKLWVHNILRMLVIYLIWSTAYGVYDYLQYKAGWKFIVWEIVNSRDHMWFLPMIIGIYIIVPILSTWVHNADKKEVEYFIGSFFVLQIVCETIKVLPLTEIAEYIVALRNIQLVCSYVGYFVIGYYLTYIGIKKKYIPGVYIAGGVAALLSIAATIGIAAYTGITSFGVVDSFSILTFVWVIAIFIFVCRAFDKNSCLAPEDRNSSEASKTVTSRLWTELGKDSLGAYLCHIAVIEVLMRIGYSADTLPIAIGIPLYVIVVFICSSIIAALLRRIPVVGRFIC